MRQALAILLGITSLALAACAGNGDGLDSNGQPIGSSGGSSSSSGSSSSGGSSSSSSSSSGSTSTVSFDDIQNNIFTPICTECHAGAGAPEGMQLSAGVSYSMIVNVPSQEVSTLDRILPGNSADSYLVQKVMGIAAVGAQMPDGCPSERPCLTTAQIDMIVDWVNEGAPPASSSSSSGASAADQASQ